MTLSVQPPADPGLPRLKPRVALSMQDERLRDALFSDRLRRRLESIAHCEFNRVIQDFTAVPDNVLAEVEVLLTGWFAPRIDAGVLERMPQLRLIAHAGGSVKGHVDPEVWKRNVQVTTAAVANAVPVAEFSLAQILLAGKSVHSAAHLYRESQKQIDRELAFPAAGNYEKTVGIVGASTIGRLVLQHLKAFDFRVVVFDPTMTEPEVAKLGARKVSLIELMRLSDVVSLHAPLLPTTVGMIGPEQLAAMRTGTMLVNTARGELVDHEALRIELRSGRLNAMLDVTTPEPLPPGDALYTMPNVLLTPHIAGSMGRELYRMTEYAVGEIERFAAGAAQLYPVRPEELATMA